MFKKICNFTYSCFYYYFPFSLKKRKIDFIFLVHARYPQDYCESLPFLSWLQFILPSKTYLLFIQSLPPFVVDVVRSKHDVKGLMLSTLLLPETLMNSRKRTETEIKRVFKLIDKMCDPANKKIVIGLGGWWPMVSRKGELFVALMSQGKYKITTGHSATTYSILKTAEHIIEKGKMNSKKTNIAIVGCGNIGKNVARLLARHNIHLTLIDLHIKKLKQFKDELLTQHKSLNVNYFLSEKETISTILNGCDFGICATSNFRTIISKENIPKNFVFIDDSRPEAIPRFTLEEKKYTLEGGLLHIKGFKSYYNVGFGNDNNILGCMSEAFILAWDSYNGSKLKETIGKVTIEHIDDLDDFCKTHRIRYGDFKMGLLKLNEDKVIESIRNRHHQRTHH